MPLGPAPPSSSNTERSLAIDESGVVACRALSAQLWDLRDRPPVPAQLAVLKIPTAPISNPASCFQKLYHPRPEPARCLKMRSERITNQPAGFENPIAPIPSQPAGFENPIACISGQLAAFKNSTARISSQPAGSKSAASASRASSLDSQHASSAFRASQLLPIGPSPFSNPASCFPTALRPRSDPARRFRATH